MTGWIVLRRNGDRAPWVAAGSGRIWPDRDTAETVRQRLAGAPGTTQFVIAPIGEVW